MVPPAVPSIWSKGFESTPSTPIDPSTSAWAPNIQLQVSRRTPHIHELMSSAIDAQAGVGARRHARTANVSVAVSATLMRVARAVMAPMASLPPRTHRRTR